MKDHCGDCRCPGAHLSYHAIRRAATNVGSMSAFHRKIAKLSLIALLYLCVTIYWYTCLFKTSYSVQRVSTTRSTVPMTHHFTSSPSEPEKEWRQGFSDDSVVPAQVLSRELIVRRVFFDRRRRGNYSNATVFLVEAKGMKLGSQKFAGCRVGRHTSRKIFYRFARSYRFVQRIKNATSTLALIECYDIRAVRDGDSASLYFKSHNGRKVEVQSLKPLFVPEPRAALDPPAVTSVVCVGMIRTGEHPPSHHGMLYHWLRYQKVIGVDHVHMAVEDNFVRAGGLQHEVIQQAVREGYLSIDFWPYWLSPAKVYNSQKLAYQDCLYRYQGVYDYIIYADSDDFFVPVGRNKSIEDYLQNWCKYETATCQFKWIQFFPDCGWDPKSIGADGNFTASMTYKPTTERSVYKSAHQLKALLDAGTHLANRLLDGYIQTEVPVNESYFAHIRFGWTPSNGC